MITTLSRRNFLADSTSVAGLAATGLAIPAAASEAETNLTALLENLQTQYPQEYPILARATKTVWSRLLTPQLVPTKVFTMATDDPDRWYSKRPYPVRLGCEYYYDGCSACQNCRLYQHDEVICKQRNMDKAAEYLESFHSRNTPVELDTDLILTLCHSAMTRIHDAPQPTTQTDLIHLIQDELRRRSVPAEWALINPRYAESLGLPIAANYDISPDELAIPGLKLYAHHASRQGMGIIFGTRQTQDDIVWMLNVLIAPGGLTINQETFIPERTFIFSHRLEMMTYSASKNRDYLSRIMFTKS